MVPVVPAQSASGTADGLDVSAIAACVLEGVRHRSRRVPAELLQDTWKSTRGRRRLGPALQTHGVGGPWPLSSLLVRGCFGHLSSTVQRPGGLLDPLSTVAAVVGTNHASRSSGGSHSVASIAFSRSVLL